MKSIAIILGPSLAPNLLLAVAPAARSGDYAVTERGTDYNAWQEITVENGSNCLHQYVELATGLNYVNSSGQLVPALEQITLLPDGTAAATQGQHQVRFPSDIFTGVIQITTPDNLNLYSRPVGISYDDGSNNVFIATLTNSIGQLVGPNQIVYPDAFAGCKADLVCTYRRSGFECDLLFRQRPPEPAACGLNGARCTLQLVTEFFNTPEPEQVPGISEATLGLQDFTLKFGQLRMAQGKAFAFNGTNSTTAAPQSKCWFTRLGRMLPTGPF